MAAYLFVHFTGTESSPLHEQVYFSVSIDGKRWELLNEGKPVLVSDVGERGVRDPFILRSPEEQKFFIIGTDLSICRRMQTQKEKTAWAQCTNARPENPNPGSSSMVVWESEDMVSWSGPRLVKAAPERAGCFWAPKGIWDGKKGAFLVAGACKMPEDDYGWLRLYRSYTRDFRTFTPAELYADLSLHIEAEREKKHIFDCAFAEEDGRYYRIFKTDRIEMEQAPDLDGPWMPVETKLSEIAPNHEGPAICRENEKEWWLLMLDNLTTRGGYQAFETDRLAGGTFRALKELSFPEGIKYRHGSLLAVTQKEYERLKERYSG